MGKKKQKKKRIDILWILFISIVYMEAVLKIFCCPDFMNVGLAYMTGFSFAVALIGKAMCSVFKKGINRRVGILVLAVLFILYGAQTIYQKCFGKFFVLYSVAAGGIGQVTGEGMIGSTIRAILAAIPILVLLAAPLAIYVLFSRRFLKSRRANWQTSAMYLIAGVVLFAGLSILSSLSYNGAFDADIAVQNGGLISMEVQDLTYNILGVEQKIELQDVEYAQGEESSKEEVEEVVYEANVMDIDFEALLETETDENVKTLHTYFAVEEPSYQNEYTGMFEGYNLIHITAEGFYPYAIDPELTPTLYKMVQEGFQFPNFYTPIWGVSTSDGEYVGCTGLIPKSGVWSFYKSGSISMPFCLGNQFEKIGVTTRRAYHNHTYDYYERHISHPNMGYDYKGHGGGVDGGFTSEQIKKTWPESDLQMVDVTTSEFIKTDEQFLAYYMTVSGHMEYTKSGNYMSYKNWSLVEHLECSDTLKAYYACNIELDRAMELLLQRLEEAGVADKTVIAISADHYPYGLESDSGDKYQYFDELAGHDVETNFELYKGIFILYNPGMEEPIVVDKYCASLDILPTLSNLFGLEYDSRLLMGKDIFSDQDPIVIFSNRSWITDKGKYNAKAKTFEAFAGQEFATEEDENAYIKQINGIVANRFKVSTLILDTDYYSKVIN